MLSIFKPASHTTRLPAAEIDPTYRRLRWQIFLGIFLVMPRTIWYVRTLPRRCRIWLSRVSPVAIWVLRYPVFPLPMVFEIHHGVHFGPLESARFPACWSDSGCSGDVVHGLCAVGDVQYRGDVCAAVPLRVVSGHGVATVWSYHGALVVAERAWRYCFRVELRA